MTAGTFALICYAVGAAVGLAIGAAFWRTHAILWRNHVGFAGKKDHR